MEEMARSIAIVFSLPASAVTTRAGLGLAPLADETSEGRSSFLLSHTRDRDGTKERESTDGRVGVDGL